MYAVVRFHLVNLFSVRAVTTNAFTARTLVCPTPAGLKLGLLSKLIERDGVGRAQEHLEWLAPLRVGWEPPPLLAVSAATMTVLKDDSGRTPLIRSVGMREYAHYDEPFGLTLGPIVSAERRADAAFALANLRALGIAESFVQPLAPPTWRDEAPGGVVWLTSELRGEARDGAGGQAGGDARGEARADATNRDGEAALLDDLGSAPSFERLSIYRPNERAYVPRLGEDRRRTIVVLPLRQRRQSLHGRELVYEPRQAPSAKGGG